MEMPKFLLGDNSEFPEAIFIVHTDFPQFVLNLANDEVEWLVEFEKGDEKQLEEEAVHLFQAANDFYDLEIASYE